MVLCSNGLLWSFAEDLKQKGRAPSSLTADMKMLESKYRRRTNVQQLTCNIDLSCSFYYLLFSLVLIELKPFVLKGKALREKF